MQKTYTTRRLILRRLGRGDFEAWRRSQEVSLPPQDKFDKSAVPVRRRTRALFNRAVRRHELLAKNDEAYIWNIFLKKTGEQIGWLDLSTIAREPYQMANLGYHVINL